MDGKAATSQARSILFHLPPSSFQFLIAKRKCGQKGTPKTETRSGIRFRFWIRDRPLVWKDREERRERHFQLPIDGFRQRRGDLLPQRDVLLLLRNGWEGAQRPPQQHETGLEDLRSMSLLL